jgi:hypothetical protein
LVNIPGGPREIAQILPQFVPEGVLRAPEPVVQNGEPASDPIPQQDTSLPVDALPVDALPVDDIDAMFNRYIAEFEDLGGS